MMAPKSAVLVSRGRTWAAVRSESRECMRITAVGGNRLKKLLETILRVYVFFVSPQ